MGESGSNRTGWRALRAIAVGALVLATTVCSEGAAPGGTDGAGRTVRAAEEVAGVLSATDTVRYNYRAADTLPFVVVLTARNDRVRLAVRDTSGRDLIAPVVAVGTRAAPATVSAGVVVPEQPTTYRFAVSGYGPYTLRVLSYAPERASARLVLNDTIAESLDGEGDADVYTFDASPGERFIGYLQTLGASQGAAQLEIRGAELLTSTQSAGNADELETQATATFGRSTAGPVSVRVGGEYQGAYRVMVRRIGLRPETVAQQPVENDTIVGERIDHVGDIDQFLIRGAPNAPYGVLFQFVGESSHRSAVAEVSADGSGEPYASVTSTELEGVLLARSTGRFALDGTGAATVTVRGNGIARGAYRLFIHRVDVRPERARPTLLPTDSVTNEALELPDDVDEYTLDLAGDDTLRFVLTYGRGIGDLSAPRGARLTLFDALGGSADLSGSDVTTSFGTEGIPLTSGRYRLRVASLGEPRGGVVGPYALKLYQLRSSPEGAVPTIAIGDTVTGVIDPAGDVDEFRLQARTGDHVRPEMQALDGGGALAVELVRARDRQAVAIADATLDFNRPGAQRVILDEGGTYLLRARSRTLGRGLDEVGRYRMVLRRIPAGPERHPGVLPVGDSVTTEGIEDPGDVDEFLVQGTAGAEYAVEFATLGDPWGLDLQLVDDGTRNVLTYMSVTGARVSFGRRVLPPSGRVILRVLERIGPPSIGRSYPYTLVTHAISRMPESRPVRFAIGDTVAGEAIRPVEDIDEFEFTGVAGQRLQALVTTRPGSSPGLAFQVFEKGTERLVAAARVDVTSWELGPNRSQVFTLPVTGAYTVRVQWPFAGTGDYRFAIVER